MEGDFQQAQEDNATELRSVCETLTSYCTDAKDVVVVREEARNWLGVRSELNGELDLQRLRHLVLSLLGFNTSDAIIQVVGDSGSSFSEEGAETALNILSKHITLTSVVEYGYTAQTYDANWVVGEMMNRQPEFAARVFANVVQKSADALGSLEWTGHPAVTTFVLPYNDDGTPTSFGDDTWLSDGIMAARPDEKMICFEGGIQAFEQAVNVLCLDIPVVVCTSLRVPGEARFSAAALLLMLRNREDSDTDDGHKSLEDYLSTLAKRDSQKESKIQDIMKRLNDQVPATRFRELVLDG